MLEEEEDPSLASSSLFLSRAAEKLVFFHGFFFQSLRIQRLFKDNSDSFSRKLDEKRLTFLDPKLAFEADLASLAGLEIWAGKWEEDAMWSISAPEEAKFQNCQSKQKKQNWNNFGPQKNV